MSPSHMEFGCKDFSQIAEDVYGLLSRIGKAVAESGLADKQSSIAELQISSVSNLSKLSQYLRERCLL